MIMTIERTFSMIKPDATERNLVGSITAMIESSGLKVIASRRTKMTPEKAAEFYGVHSERPFFQSLCDFMCSGPIIVQVLEGENAVKKNREIMGATNPEDAEDGTIRKVHAVSLEKNSVHGSDSSENAAIEIAHFFAEEEIYP
jgi:nucleoside-diphosphate kinase